MSLTTSQPSSGYPTVWERQSPKEKLIQWLWLVGCALAAVWSISELDIEWMFLMDAHIQAMDIAERMWPPRWSYAPTIIAPLIETVHIATLGTIIAVALALPVAFLAARNTSANTLTWAIGRGILVGSRSINTVVWGLHSLQFLAPAPSLEYSQSQPVLLASLPNSLPRRSKRWMTDRSRQHGQRVHRPFRSGGSPSFLRSCRS